MFMRKASIGINGWRPLFPKKVRLIRTGLICENIGYYGDLFTLKLPDGSLAEFHLRDIDIDLPARLKAPRVHPVKPSSVQ
jgi:hypothetical protein